MKHYVAENEGVHQSIPRRVEKDWGSENVLYNKHHCVKIMTLKSGQQVSMHWHQSKDETFVLISGSLVIETIDKFGQPAIVRLTDQFDSLTLKSNTPHTFYCPSTQGEETVFIEASTTDHPDDSFRIYPSGPKGKYSTNR